MTRRIIWGAYALIIFCLFATEAAFYLGEWSPLKRYAAFFWIFCSVIVVLSAWVCAFIPFFEKGFWALPHRTWYLVAFFLPPLLILVDGGGTRFTSVDAEGLIQLAGGMDLMHRDPSLGVFRMEYYRYLDRQYILNSLPSCIFGPSLWAARVGNSMFYIGGYLFFLSSLANYFRRKGTSDPLFFAAFCGIMIALGQYTLLTARMFEQTTMPIGVTLFFLAALLCFIAEPGPLRYLWLTWSFGFFTECYTPALGGWVLALGILLYLIFWRRRSLFVPTLAYGMVCLFIAYQITRKADPVALAGKFSIGTSDLTGTDRAFRIFRAFRAVIGTDYALIPVPLVLTICAAIYLGWRFRDYRYLAICAWAAAMGCLSVTLVGSNLSFPDYDVHRALTIIPPLALGAVILCVRFLSGPDMAPSSVKFVRFFMHIFMGFMVITGICTVFLVRSFFGVNTPTDYDEVLSKINELSRSPTSLPLTRVYLVPPLYIDLQPALQYFAPGAKAVYAKPPAGEKTAGAYILSYAKDAADRRDDEIVPSRHPRPFIRMDAE